MKKAYIPQMVESQLVRHQIDSYNDFIKTRMQKIVNEVGEIRPELPGGEELVIKLGELSIDHPTVKEADGSMRTVYPTEARARDLSYTARVNVKMTPIFEGVKQIPEVVTIGEIPVMIRSNICSTAGMNEDALEGVGEDPNDPGGYFVINGTEKVIVSLEELTNNIPIYQEDAEGPFVRINSERQGYVQRHQLRRTKEGMLELTFANIKKVPVVLILRALGLETDKEIIDAISEKHAGDIYLNMYDSEVSTQEEALEEIGRLASIHKDRGERVLNILDRYLLPHIGQEFDSRVMKATYLGNLARNVIALSNDEFEQDDIDHYAFKRLRLAGDLLEMQFRSVFLGKWGFVARMMYNFQKSAKRGRFPSLQSTVVSDILTKQLMSAMATGNWVGGRTGVAQRLERDNRMKMIDHLRNVLSPLSSQRQHFEARELHPTHWGRLDPIKTPEGMNIGLRKYLAISATLTRGLTEKDRNALKLDLEDCGVKPVAQ